LGSGKENRVDLVPAASKSRSGTFQMNWIDIVILAILLLISSLGSGIGVIRAACVFGTFILATIVASRASVIFAALLAKLMYNRELGYIISFAAVFVLTFIGLSFICSAIKKMAQFAPLRWIDRGIGGILGFLAGSILVGLALVYLTQSPISNSEQWIDGSFLAPIIKGAVSPLFQEFLEKDNAIAPVVFSRIVFALSRTIRSFS